LENIPVDGIIILKWIISREREVKTGVNALSIEVKFTLEQVMKAQRGSRVIDLLFL
jgi:hypothetical protein